MKYTIQFHLHSTVRHLDRHVILLLYSLTCFFRIVLINYVYMRDKTFSISYLGVEICYHFLCRRQSPNSSVLLYTVISLHLISRIGPRLCHRYTQVALSQFTLVYCLRSTPQPELKRSSLSLYLLTIILQSSEMVKFLYQYFFLFLQSEFNGFKA